MKNKLYCSLLSSIAASLFFFSALEANLSCAEQSGEAIQPLSTSVYQFPSNACNSEEWKSEVPCSLTSCCEGAQTSCSLTPCCECTQSPCTLTPCCEGAQVPCLQAPCCGNLRFSVRVGGFYGTNRTLRDTFGCVGALYGLTASYSICGCATGFIDGDYYDRSGRPCCEVKKSNIRLWTSSLGICFPLKICTCVEPYVGLGATVGSVKLRDHFFDDTSCHTSKTAFGGVLKSGIIIPFGSCWFGELFCDYLYLPIHFERRVNLGGIKFGGGIGVAF